MQHIQVKYIFVNITVTTYQQICVLQILFPEGADLPLTPNVPNIQFHAMTGYTLNVEALECYTKHSYMDVLTIFSWPDKHQFMAK